MGSGSKWEQRDITYVNEIELQIVYDDFGLYIERNLLRY